MLIFDIYVYIYIVEPLIVNSGASANKLRGCSASQRYMMEPKFKCDRPRTSALRNTLRSK